jgi:hypothetical protein
MTLSQTLLQPGKRPTVVTDCVALIDAEVDAKSGLTGLAVKAAYAVVKKVKPGIIREAVDNLLDEFVTRLDPFHAAAVGSGQPLGTYFAARADEIANALLAVTDARAARSRHKTIKAAYDKLRPTGVKHTAAAVPGMARLLTKHA